MMMNFQNFMEWAFLAVVSGGVYVLYQMKESLNNLSSKIEVMVVEHEKTRTEVEDHELRIREIEHRNLLRRRR